MSGKAGKSGPPGNLNASRHGLTTWLKRRALPPDKAHLAPFIQSFREGLLTCKGGEDQATEVEVGLIDNATRAHGACLLILEEAATRGWVRQISDTWDLSPGLARLAVFLNAERQALIALGLERRAKDLPDLARAFAQAQRQQNEGHDEG